MYLTTVINHDGRLLSFHRFAITAYRHMADVHKLIWAIINYLDAINGKEQVP